MNSFDRKMCFAVLVYFAIRIELDPQLNDSDTQTPTSVCKNGKDLIIGFNVNVLRIPSQGNILKVMLNLPVVRHC